MKNRDYKNFSKGSVFHIYNRGNNKENIFRDENDFRAFLFRLGLVMGYEAKELENYSTMYLPYSRIRISGYKKDDFKIHAFCIMPNHFHLLVEQCGEISISKLILKTCTSYAMYFNKKYGRVGHLFQDQYKAVLVESNPQLMWVTAYIHMNPVRGKIVNHPQKYEWSSYCDYIDTRKLPITYRDFLMETFGTNKNFETETLSLANSTDMPRVTLGRD